MYVKVRFKYATKGQRPSVIATEVVRAEGFTESAVMAALQRKYPNRDMIILEMDKQ